MTTLTDPVDLLRQAERLLRERAKAASGLPIIASTDACGWYELVPPDVAEPLAAWVAYEARLLAGFGPIPTDDAGRIRPSIGVARAIVEAGQP